MNSVEKKKSVAGQFAVKNSPRSARKLEMRVSNPSTTFFFPLEQPTSRMSRMMVGGGENVEMESSGGFQFEEVEICPCFIKDSTVKGLWEKWVRP